MIDGWLVELLLTGLAIGAWAIATVRMRGAFRRQPVHVGIMSTLVWATLIALLLRALYDGNVLSEHLALIAAGFVLAAYIIVGIATAIEGWNGSGPPFGVDDEHSTEQERGPK